MEFPISQRRLKTHPEKVRAPETGAPLRRGLHRLWIAFDLEKNGHAVRHAVALVGLGLATALVGAANCS